MRGIQGLRLVMFCGLLGLSGGAFAQTLAFAPEAARPRNILEAIFGVPKRAAPASHDFAPPTPPVSLRNAPPTGPQTGSPATPNARKSTSGGSSHRAYGGGGSQPVCVRTCDGFFFPVNYEGARGADRYQEACQASCPSAETEVFFMPPGADLTRASNAKGKNYTQLANAFRYRKERDATCSCKDANQSWAEALAGAEGHIRQNKKDVIVTEQASEDSIRPTIPAQDRRPAEKQAQEKPILEKPATEKLASIVQSID